jgi:predicted 3-demethylubiquinone-9 3-methyltransferase (glyoxalase superfamily)
MREIALQKITPNIWFNRNAKEAVDFYLTTFPDAKILTTSYYPKEGLAEFQKEFAGDVLAINFEIQGQRFVAINADKTFTPNPSISFFINFDPLHNPNAEIELDKLWKRLSENGKVLISLQEYPFSKKYGWIQDRYGVSWQLILTNPKGEKRPFIVPSFLFVNERCGKAEEATNFYLSLFKQSQRHMLVHYDSAAEPNKAGTVMFTDFTLAGQFFAAMDAGGKHDFRFSEGISLNISCKDQQEIDYYWDALTRDGGEASMCGWLKDKYGVSWQVNPENIEELMQKSEAFQKLMEMKKIIINIF